MARNLNNSVEFCSKVVSSPTALLALHWVLKVEPPQYFQRS